MNRSHYRTAPKRSTEILRGLLLAVVLGIIGALILSAWGMQ